MDVQHVVYIKNVMFGLRHTLCLSYQINLYPPLNPIES